jgi:hypothetical protein
MASSPVTRTWTINALLPSQSADLPVEFTQASLQSKQR